MTGYYALEFLCSDRKWLRITYWEMEESLLPDFLLHTFDLHHMVEHRNDLRVKRITYAELLEKPDECGQYEYLGLHLHTSISE
jgi:hypothetical protein